MLRTARPYLCAALLGGVLALPATAEPAPERVVSINLCADELLIALADPAQIADLSI
jgi:iron complex transport system substrate-binding protein